MNKYLKSEDTLMLNKSKWNIHTLFNTSCLYGHCKPLSLLKNEIKWWKIEKKMWV